jgi:MarR family 2-MHQ and catechol resistance regulon transcriptional repressor
MSYGAKEDKALGLWVKLARAFSMFNKKSGEDIARYKLTTPQFGVLEVLYHKGPMTIGNLCKKMLVSGGNMTVVIDNLERTGMVERCPIPEDRRAIEVRLTAKGDQLIKKIFPGHAEEIAKIASVLSEREQADLAALLKKLGKSIE